MRTRLPAATVATLVLLLFGSISSARSAEVDRGSGQDSGLREVAEAVASTWRAGAMESLQPHLASSGVDLEIDGVRNRGLAPRHATAALRELHEIERTVTVDLGRVSEGGGSPPRGYAEFAWTAEHRGAAEPSRFTVFVGFHYDIESDHWRVDEIRVMRE